MLTTAPTALMYGNNYGDVTYRPTEAGVLACTELIEKVTAMRKRELQLTRAQAQLLRILVTAYKKGDGWTGTGITDRNLPVITTLYNAGILTTPRANTLPYYS